MLPISCNSSDNSFSSLHTFDVLYLQMIIQEARVAGCRTPNEAEIFLDKKRKRESEGADHRVKESNLTGAGSRGNSIMFTPSESAGKDSNSRPAVQALSGSVNDFDMFGADFLSEAVSAISHLLNEHLRAFFIHIFLDLRSQLL